MTLTKKLAVLVAGGALLAGTTACASNSPTPASNTSGTNSSSTPAANGDAKSLYMSAAAKMYDATDATVTMKLDTTADEIKKLGTLGTNPSAISDPIANFIAGASLTYKVHGTTALKALADDPTQIANTDLGIVFKSGSQEANILLLDQWGSVYVKAPIVDMYKTFTGKDLSGQLGMAPDWVQQMANDKWVGIQFPAAFKDQLKKSMATAKPSVSTNQVDMMKLIEDNATFTDKGDKDGGKAIQMALKLKPVMEKVSQSSGKATDAANYAQTEKYIKDDAVAVVDMVIKGDHITSGRFDIAQVKDWIDSSQMTEKDRADWNKFVALDLKAAFEMKMDQSADLTKPSDARMVTQQELQQLGGMFGAS